ncbi:uncharacterized protein [Amphiura filiformis]|uniref:uncharacterized protein n=1 Tax=Amphiura filiformis TaxID=82378 RepID=UPI003B21B7D1
MKYGARKRGGGKSHVENKHTKEEFDLLTNLLQTSVRISRPKKEEEEKEKEEKEESKEPGAEGEEESKEEKMEEGEGKEAEGEEKEEEEDTKEEEKGGGDADEDEEGKEGTDVMNLQGTPIVHNNTVVHQVKLLRMFRMEFFMYDKVLKDLFCYICNVPCWQWPNYWSHLESKKHKENVGSVKTDFGTTRRVALARELSALPSVHGPEKKAAAVAAAVAAAAAEEQETETAEADAEKTEAESGDAEMADAEAADEDEKKDEEKVEVKEEEGDAPAAVVTEEADKDVGTEKNGEKEESPQDLEKDDYYFVCRVCLSINPGPIKAHMDCEKHKYLEKSQQWCEDCNLFFNRGRKFIHHFQTALHKKMCGLKGKPVQVPTSVASMSAKAKAAKDKAPGIASPTQDNPVGMKFAQHGLWCKLCTTFYPSGDCTRKQHCCSEEHHKNFEEWLATKRKEEVAAKGVAAFIQSATDEPRKKMMKQPQRWKRIRPMTEKMAEMMTMTLYLVMIMKEMGRKVERRRRRRVYWKMQLRRRRRKKHRSHRRSQRKRK